MLPHVKVLILNRSRVNSGFGDPLLDAHEPGQHEHATDERGHHPRVRPAHRVTAVGLNAVRDPDEHRDQADREGDVAAPVHPGPLTHAGVVQFEVRPDRADQTERDGHQEDQVPGDRREHPADDQAEEAARDGGDAVDAQRETTLAGRERVGEDRAGVRHQERTADTLHDSPRDQPDRGGVPAHPGDREHDRRDGEDQEAEVVHPGAAVDVAEPPERDHQHGGHHQEAQHHPEQITGVARVQRVDPDALEDVRQRDQHDRRVDRRDQQTERRVRQRDPLVPRPELIQGLRLRTPPGHHKPPASRFT